MFPFPSFPPFVELALTVYHGMPTLCSGPAPASTPRSFEDIPIPRLDEPWLLPELSEAEKAGTERQNEADADEGERGEATTIPGALFQMGEKHPLHPIYFTKSGVTHTWQFTTFAYVLCPPLLYACEMYNLTVVCVACSGAVTCRRWCAE
jgi:hypothetical protein